MLDYSPLWNTMHERHVTQYDLTQAGINNKIMHTLRHNGNITLLTLEKLCKIINCTPNDVVRFTEESDQQG